MALPPGRHADGGGLYMQVLPGGTRSWLFRYDLQRKCRWMGLGAVDAGRLADSLAQARRAAADAREQLRDGKDPLAVKRAKAAAMVPARIVLFSECAEAYLAAHQSSWRSPIHTRQWRQCLDDYVLPVLGPLPVAGVGPGDAAHPPKRDRMRPTSHLDDFITTTRRFVTCKVGSDSGCKSP